MSETSAIDKAKTKLRSGKTLEILAIIVLVIAVTAILLFSFQDDKASADTSSEDYAAMLETKLIRVLSQIEGAGTVDAAITVKSEGETVLAMETVVNEDGSVTTRPVLVNGDVVVLEVKNPEITGVLVVAEGADELNVRFNLLEATASVLNINQSIIKVYTKGGSGQ